MSFPYDKKEEKAARKAEHAQARVAEAASSRAVDLEAKFWATPYGQARRAKVVGDRYFVIELLVDTRSQAALGKPNPDSRGTSGGAMLTFIEKEGWELVEAGFVYRETGQVSQNRPLATGQRTFTGGNVWGGVLVPGDGSAGKD